MIYLIGVRRKFNIFNPASYLPALIRKIAKIPYNHIIVYDNKTKLATEAVAQGVIIHDLTSALKPQDEAAIYEFIEPIDYEQQIAHIVSSVGHKYDLKELLYYQLIQNITGKQFQGSKDNNDKFICYSLAAYVFMQEDYYKVKPKEFLKKFKVVGYGSIDNLTDWLNLSKLK